MSDPVIPSSPESHDVDVNPVSATGVADGGIDALQMEGPIGLKSYTVATLQGVQQAKAQLPDPGGDTP